MRNAGGLGLAAFGAELPLIHSAAGADPAVSRRLGLSALGTEFSGVSCTTGADPASGGLGSGFGPVSYTHLDVYKRQPEHNTELGHIFFRPKAKRRTGAVDLIVDGGKQIFLNGAPSEFLVGADLHIQLDPLTLLAGPDFLQPDCLGGQLIVI